MGESLAFHSPGFLNIKLRYTDVRIVPSRQYETAVQRQCLSLGEIEKWELEIENQTKAKGDEISMSFHG
jgi:hypothetical protein